MKSRVLWPAGWLAFILTTVSVVIVAQRPPEVPGLNIHRAPRKCTVPPNYRVGYEREANGVSVAANGGFTFQGVAWLQADICTPGTLTIVADGRVGGGEAPELNVAVDSNTLSAEQFSERRTIQIRVPQAGQLSLAYLNDFYRSDARVGTLENIRFSGRHCRTFTATVPPKTGGGWYPIGNVATLVSDVPMTLTPCSAGTFRIRVVGRAGNQVFPTLVFSQNGVLLRRVQTQTNRQDIALTVGVEPVTVTLINPFFRELDDRNLYIRRLSFSPDPATAP